MSHFLYGSSNVYRHIKKTPGLGLDLTLVECTKKTVFDAHLASLSGMTSGSLLVTSVLANFIVDACRDLEPAEIGLFANQQVTAHVDSLASIIRANPEAVCIIVPPLLRNVPGTEKRFL
jgi:hypothetical protein